VDRVGAIRAAFDGLDISDPVVAFAYGVAFGRALESEVRDELDDLIHRSAAREVRRVIDWTEARA